VSFFNEEFGLAGGIAYCFWMDLSRQQSNSVHIMMQKADRWSLILGGTVALANAPSRLSTSKPNLTHEFNNEQLFLEVVVDDQHIQMSNV
jgi:hypothetical protein